MSWNPLKPKTLKKRLDSAIKISKKSKINQNKNIENLKLYTETFKIGVDLEIIAQKAQTNLQIKKNLQITLKKLGFSSHEELKIKTIELKDALDENRKRNKLNVDYKLQSEVKKLDDNNKRNDDLYKDHEKELREF